MPKRNIVQIQPPPRRRTTAGGHGRLHRRHDGQLCHRPDWKPTAATQATSTATNGSSIFTAGLLAIIE